jgi:hypothetical protein
MSSALQSITLSGQLTLHGSGSLTLSDTLGFKKTISAPDSPASYSFTTTKTDLVTACVSDSSASGTVTFAGQLNQFSGNYAGYGVNGFNSSPNVYSIVVGSWTVPQIRCTPLVETSETATWIGLGGLANTGSSMLEQTGIDEQCYKGTPHYNAVTEMVPSDSSFVVIPYGCSDNNQTSCTQVSPTVNPGDSFSSEVAYTGSGNFFMQLHDATQQWHFSTTRTQTNSADLSARYTAEWIQEGPQPTLTDFGEVTFSNCAVDGYSIRNAGPIVEQYTMKQNGSSTIQAQPLGLTGDGSSFSVLFEHH